MWTPSYIKLSRWCLVPTGPSEMRMGYHAALRHGVKRCANVADFGRQGIGEAAGIVAPTQHKVNRMLANRGRAEPPYTTSSKWGAFITSLSTTIHCMEARAHKVPQAAPTASEGKDQENRGVAQDGSPDSPLILGRCSHFIAGQDRQGTHTLSSLTRHPSTHAWRAPLFKILSRRRCISSVR